MTPLHTISPARRLISNGIAVFGSLRELTPIRTPHTLAMTLLVICGEGEISGIIDLTPRSMRGGSMMVLRRGHVIHDIRESSEFRGFYILADEDKLDGLLPMMTYMAPCMAYFKDNPIVRIPDSELENVRMLHSLLRAKYRAADGVLPYNKMTINALCEALFYETLGIYTNLMNRQNRVPSRREELLSRFISLVEQDFRRERTVIYYARQMGLSPKHLSAAVKSVSGLTAGEWIDRKVILEAKLMLRNSSMTVQNISSALNFANQSFFGKYFKHLTGKSPREFRSNPDA